MTKKDHHECGVFVSVAYFCVNSTGWWISCYVQTFSKSWKSHFKHFERKIAYLLPCKLKIAQCKQSQLVNPLLDFDLNFIFKSSGTALLETIGSY